MEFTLSCKGSAYPCEVIIDDDNGRYLVRKADSSGEHFNDPTELVSWVISNWKEDQFDDGDQFETMVETIKQYCKTE